MNDLVADSPFRHVALFYHGQAEYLAAVTEFLRAAQDRGEPVFAALPGERIHQVARALGDAARPEFVDMAVIGRNPAAIIPVIRAFTSRHAGQRVSFLGEPAWPSRRPAELIEATRHEALMNLAFETTPLSIFCPYDAVTLPSATLADAWCTHPVVTERGDRRRSQSYLGPHGLPPCCELPLADPPAAAEGLSYRADLRPLRAMVADRAAAAGLPDTRITDLVLAVSEVAANTLRHTPGGGRLAVWLAEGEILCEIRDGGRISDPLAGRLRQGPEPLAGRQGLWVVNKVCDLVEMRSGRSGTTVRLHMRLGVRAPAVPGARPRMAPRHRPW